MFVVYCAGPHCNGADQAALKLARLGRPVKIMIGGITGWVDEGFAFASGDEPGSIHAARRWPWRSPSGHSNEGISARSRTHAGPGGFRTKANCRANAETPIALPREALAIALANLAENALQHGASRLQLIAATEERMLTLVVSDDGSGIPEGNRALIFLPFFSTRRENGGTGMGLAITQAMLAAHGGTIRLLEADGSSASIEITLPAVA